MGGSWMDQTGLSIVGVVGIGNMWTGDGWAVLSMKLSLMDESY